MDRSHAMDPTRSEERDELLAELGRELRHPLDAFRASIEATLEDPQGDFDETQRTYLQSLGSLCDELLALAVTHLGGENPSVEQRIRKPD
jgi:signal transduction histidine kinase